MNPFPASFFDASAATVAPALLGHWLCRREDDGGFSGGMIVETEAYLAHGDPACHAARGQTGRNRSMWGPPGRAYIYFIYGVHHCFNIVCRPVGLAEAVLVRAVEATVGLPHLRLRRTGVSDRELMNGPGKLCLALGIDLKSDGLQLDDPDSSILVVSNPDREGAVQRTGPIRASPRIGITTAADLMLRFALANSGFISRPA